MQHTVEGKSWRDWAKGKDQMSELLFLLRFILLVAGLLILMRSLVSRFPSAHDSELVRVLFQITDPILDPIRRFLPATGGLDFSPMIALVAIYALYRVLSTL